MPELLKNMYNLHFFDGFCKLVEESIPDFNKGQFLNLIYTSAWENLELKQRMRHITLVLSEFLPLDYTKALPYILAIKEKAQNAGLGNSFIFMFLPDFIEVKGLAHFDKSVKAMEEITSLASAEFAIRPFLIKYEEKMLAQMFSWSQHPDLHVRRLASEGCRPLLPWAMAVPFLKKSSELVLPVLENLKADPSEYVRRSVANNLNDVSKIQPQLVLQLARKWAGNNPDTDRLLKHACRTLIKQGNAEILKIFGFENKNAVSVTPLLLDKEKYTIGEVIKFSFSCLAEQQTEIRLQYVVDFAKKSGKSSRKVFFLAENRLKPGEVCLFHKKIKLQHYSTRKLYEGLHRITIMLNGEEKLSATFYLS